MHSGVCDTPLQDGLLFPDFQPAVVDFAQETVAEVCRAGFAAQLERADTVGSGFQVVAIYVDAAFAHSVNIYLCCLAMQVGDFHRAYTVYFETDVSGFQRAFAFEFAYAVYSHFFQCGGREVEGCALDVLFPFVVYSLFDGQDAVLYRGREPCQFFCLAFDAARVSVALCEPCRR